MGDEHEKALDKCNPCSCGRGQRRDNRRGASFGPGGWHLATQHFSVHLRSRPSDQGSNEDVLAVRAEHHARHENCGRRRKEATAQTTYQLDGKDYPITGIPDYDSLSAQQVDSNTAKFTFKKGGKVVGTSSRTVSKDGKTLTSNIKVTTAKGEESESVTVFDKQ